MFEQNRVNLGGHIDLLKSNNHTKTTEFVNPMFSSSSSRYLPAQQNYQGWCHINW